MAAIPDHLLELALNYFARRGQPARVEDDGIVTPRGRYGLINLAQLLCNLPLDDWPARVEEHFDRLEAVGLDFPTSYESAQRRLRVRLAPEDAASFPVARPIAAGLVEVLMMKIPIGGMSVTAETLERWQVDPDQVWRDARQATLWDEPRQRSRLVSPQGHRFTRIEGSFWTSSLLLDLGRFLPASAGGALAVVPCQDLLIFRPLDGEPVWADLVNLAGVMYRLGPGSISPDVFWWDDGRIERVVEWTGRGPVPTWSRRFRRAMEARDSAA